MAISTQSMTPEQMKSVVIEYFKRFDRGGDVLALFADDADVYFPKWGVARGKDEIARCFGDVAQLFTSILHHPEYLKLLVQEDVVVAEGITSGVSADGVSWRGGGPHARRGVGWVGVRDLPNPPRLLYPDPGYPRP